ncbi:hypothetical protein FKW77_008414 [Venturia effusa]|uniref:Uncharacterized protein n=1 Tax=Venturia effusa TaxID=50376 RepID=A0A517L3U6_9PEZI|nr:hypothetical protein FKW77_008414 [Venturia effusa]
MWSRYIARSVGTTNAETLHPDYAESRIEARRTLPRLDLTAVGTNIGTETSYTTSSTLMQKDAQGHGEGLRNWFTVPKAVSNAVTVVKSYVSPKRERTRVPQDLSTTPPSPSPQHVEARTTGGGRRSQVRNKKAECSNQGTEKAADKVSRGVYVEVNGSPRVARRRDSYAPNGSNPQLSPSKSRPSKRQRTSHESRAHTEGGAEAGPRITTSRILQWQKEPRPGSRSSSRARQKKSTAKREALSVNQDKENEVHKDEDEGMFEDSLVSKRSLKRKRDECANTSRTPPSRSHSKRNARLSSNPSSPSRSSTKTSSSRTLQSLKISGASSPSNSSISSSKRKRKRETPEGAPALHSSPQENRPTLSPTSPALETPELELPAMPRQRSASVSSNQTIEDVLSSGEIIHRQLWPVVQTEKSSRDCKLSSSPPSPEPTVAERAPSLSLPSKASTSFSSLLRSSQPSKRVVAHGQEVVLGSDEDSDESLPDVGVLFKRKKPNPAPKIDVDESKPKEKYAFSMQALLQEEKQAKAADARIEAARSRLQTYSNIGPEGNGQIVTSESAMACLVEHADQDEGNARRVKDALRRTEVLDYHEVWHFFDDDLPAIRPNPFPRFQTSNKPLASILNNPAKRQQAFMTGFLTRLTAHAALPKEIMLWMMDEVCREPKEILVQSYINVLGGSIARHEQAVTPARIDAMFKRLGVNKAVFTPDSTVPVSKEPVGIDKRPISGRVCALVTLVERLAHHLMPDSRKRALHLLALSSFDDSVIQDCRLGVRIEAAIDKLLQAIPEEGFEQELLEISGHLFRTVKSPVLRDQLISALPCYSSRSHRLRRQLALAFALKSATHLETSLDNPKTMSHVLLSLHKGKQFHITRKTDYMVTAAYFSMLDVAIDAGFSDLEFTDDQSTESGPEERPNVAGKKAIAARRARKAAIVNTQEVAFNEDIDSLAKEVRDIMALIPDTGASDMAKTECKATAGRLVKRLENGVRTKLKPIKDYYRQNDQGRKLMRDFVKRDSKRESADVSEGEALGADLELVGTSVTADSTRRKEQITGNGDGALTPRRMDKEVVSDAQQKTPPHSGREEV